MIEIYLQKQSKEKLLDNKNFKIQFLNKLIDQNQFDSIHKIKKQLINKKRISSLEYWVLNTLTCLNKCFNPNRHKISNKIDKLILKNLEISSIIKKNFDLDFLKKLLLTEKQNEIFKYQMRYINFANLDESMQYLRNLEGENYKKEDKKNNNKRNPKDFKKYFLNF